MSINNDNSVGGGVRSKNDTCRHHGGGGLVRLSIERAHVASQGSTRCGLTKEQVLAWPWGRRQQQHAGRQTEAVWSILGR